MTRLETSWTSLAARCADVFLNDGPCTVLVQAAGQQYRRHVPNPSTAQAWCRYFQRRGVSNINLAIQRHP